MTKTPSRPFPAIVEEIIEKVWMVGVEHESSTIPVMDAKMKEATQAILQAVRQLIEDGMPSKLDTTKATEWLGGDNFISYEKGYGRAIDHIRDTLLEGLGGS